VAFDVIIPSLPGYSFSSAPPANWTLRDTARVYNTLATEVLGYKKYAVHGTDLGAPVAYSLYEKYNTTVRAGHLIFFPFYPLSQEQLAAQNISLNALEKFEADRYAEWSATGNAYLLENSFKASRDPCHRWKWPSDSPYSQTLSDWRSMTIQSGNWLGSAKSTLSVGLEVRRSVVHSC